jgi:pimeloyl-ACP methyl ester carboxylesterase
VAIDRNLAVIEPPELQKRFAEAFARYGTVVTQQDCVEVMKDLLPFFFADPWDPRIQDYLFKTRDASYSPEMFQASAESGPLGVDLEERLSEIKAPTLLLAGRFDRASAPEASESMAGAIAGSELRILEQSGHMTYVEEQEAFVTSVGDFLSKHL